MNRKMTRFAFGAKCGFCWGWGEDGRAKPGRSLAESMSASASRPKLFADRRSMSRRDSAGVKVLQKEGICPRPFRGARGSRAPRKSIHVHELAAGEQHLTPRGPRLRLATRDVLFLLCECCIVLLDEAHR